MEHKSQVEEWLRKLQRESWQLELLVSAFTIFLLIQANSAFQEFFSSLPYRYNINESILAFIYLFLGLIGLSIKALTIFLVVHLLLRGFWIGTIGLRSVQDRIDFDGLKYSPFFTDLLRKRVLTLDKLVTTLDEICSVIFSFSFLSIWMLISFGLVILFFGVIGLIVLVIGNWLDGWMATAFSIFSLILIGSFILSGLIYIVDYFSLGFFKKFQRISRLYAIIYRFFGWITLSQFSNSIYYYLISKFSKKRIRWIYLLITVILVSNVLWGFDQFIYYPSSDNSETIESNFYDDARDDGSFIEKASVPSKVISGPFIELFIRYNPEDNESIAAICPDFPPAKNEGINPNFQVNFREQGIEIVGHRYSEEKATQLLQCFSQFFVVSVNDSTLNNLEFHFYQHPQKRQKGIFTMINTDSLDKGKNTIELEKRGMKDGKPVKESYARIPFWLSSN